MKNYNFCSQDKYYADSQIQIVVDKHFVSLRVSFVCVSYFEMDGVIQNKSHFLHQKVTCLKGNYNIVIAKQHLKALSFKEQF
jgi:hypothetical protein